jgi:hypothetical protein
MVMKNSTFDSSWWPAFCLAYDLGAAASLAWLIKRHPQIFSAPRVS